MEREQLVLLLKSMAYRQHICAVAGAISCVLACFACQHASATEPKRVVLIYNSGYAQLLAGNIRAELIQRSPEILKIYSAPFAAAADEGVMARYADYLGALIPRQRIDLAVTVGSPAMNFFQQYGRQFFASAPMLSIVEESRVPPTLGRNETIVTSPLDLVAAARANSPFATFRAHTRSRAHSRENAMHFLRGDFN